MFFFLSFNCLKFEIGQKCLGRLELCGESKEKLQNPKRLQPKPYIFKKR